jgi:hypothetical protein
VLFGADGMLDGIMGNDSVWTGKFREEGHSRCPTELHFLSDTSARGCRQQTGCLTSRPGLTHFDHHAGFIMLTVCLYVWDAGLI